MSEIRLPKQWIEVELDDVVDKIVGGGTPSKTVPSYFQGNIPWMTVKDMNKFVLTDTVDHISEEAVENSATNIIPAGTPIIATRMSLGKLVRANFDSAINQDLKAIFVNENVSKIYFEYWYRSISHKIQEMGTGTTVKGIRLEDIKQLNFALAPLAEQQQIAQKLDELLAQVDTLKTRLEAIPKILKRFRQSVLAAAVSGRLTEEWSERLGVEYIQIDESFFNEIENFNFYPIPKTWVYVRMDEVSGFQQGMQIAKSTRHKVGGPNRLPILRIGNYSNGFTDDVEFVDVDENSLVAEPEDLILTRTGESRGRVLTGYKGVFHNNTFRLNYRKELILREYLNIYLDNEQTQNFIKNESGRSAQPDLTHKKFGVCPISLPGLKEQAEIVRRVEQLFTYADQIEQHVKDSQARVNHLTQSILAKAFRGELTADWRAQNLELISGENSAAVLLERIRAERAAAAKPKKKVAAR